uniref:PKD domain-containing protein n=1 Tax=Kofleria flava TaxID=694315 RepID=A0A3S5GXM0_9BACT|nr:hypothetical protein [Kofleria flava]
MVHIENFFIFPCLYFFESDVIQSDTKFRAAGADRRFALIPEEPIAMKNHVLSKLGLGLGAVLLLLGGCTEPDDVSSMGTARLRIEAARTDAGEVSLVRVTALGGFETELTRDNSGAFVGSLILPAGFNEITGSAFAGDQLVGISAPVPVEIQAGFVTAATIRIIDITGGGDIGHSPIILTLTHPLSAVTNHPVQISVTAVDPDGDALNAAWSAECADGTISFPDSLFTEFSKTTPGTCRVNVTVNDGALSATESFTIVVFDENNAQGAVNVDGQFVSAPQLFLEVGLPNSFCNLFSGSQDGTCQGSIASPNRAFVNAFVDWGNGVPGFIEVTDNCGGIFESPFSDPFFFQGDWLPPTFESVCLITARAFSGDGLFSQLSAAVLVRPGEPPQPVTPEIFLTFSHSNGFCEALPGQSDPACDQPVRAGELASVQAQVDWRNQAPGFIEIFDTCGGFFTDLLQDPFFVQGSWRAPSFDTPCAMVVNAVSADGTLLTSSVLQFTVSGQTQDGIQALVQLQHANGFCELFPGQSATDCGGAFAGDRPFMRVDIGWGNAVPGFIDVSDNCGGAFNLFVSDSFRVEAEWIMPFAPGALCTVNVGAFAGDGQFRSFQLNVPLF